ncbi:cytochrome P450 [Thozetella sp. PMI_491]|nr:cytochrome P450 [Thozetella sp. PMI_491]
MAIFQQLVGPSILQLIIYSFLGLFTWIVSVAVYRRWFHPLATVPGPFLPAVTRLYLWYFTIVEEGQFYREIERLHRIYGPIIRIAPNEIHLSDPDDYDIVYSVGSRFFKDPGFYGVLGVDNMFATPSNEIHRKRRAPLNNFFSRRSVLALEDIVQNTARKLCAVVARGIEAGTPVDLDAGMRAVSIDVITEYAFDDCWGQLDREDLGTWWSEMVRSATLTFLNNQQFPFMVKIRQSIPQSWALKYIPSTKGFLLSMQRSQESFAKTKRDADAGKKESRPTIFHTLLSTDPSLYDIPLDAYCIGESFSFLQAASDTTGNAMSLAAYRIMSSPEVYATLRKELCDAFPDPDNMPLAELEKLPYLTGVVKEGLRLSYGVLTRLPRQAPPEGTTLKGKFIPDGTVVSMSAYMLHRDEGAFPDPERFDPLRWIASPELLHMREHCLVPFSRGSRMCIGQNLAMCEMYVTLGMLFRRFEGLEPYDCGPADMKYVEVFTAYHPKDARPFRVIGKA